MGQKDTDLVPKGRHFGIQFLVMGGACSVGYGRQGPIGKQPVVERKEMISSVDTEQIKRIPIRKKNR
jgi:hypothetical protein